MLLYTLLVYFTRFLDGDKDGLLLSNKYTEFGYRGVHHTHV